MHDTVVSQNNNNCKTKFESQQKKIRIKAKFRGSQKFYNSELPNKAVNFPQKIIDHIDLHTCTLAPALCLLTRAGNGNDYQT